MEMKRAHPWLFSRNGHYYLRAKVPADLIAVVGRVEFKKSRRTRIRREAEKRIEIEAAALRVQFDLWRKAGQPSDHHSSQARSPTDLRKIAVEWFERNLNTVRSVFGMNDQDREALVEELEQQAAQIWIGDPDAISESLRDAEKELGHASVASPQWRELAELLTRAKLESYRQQVARLKGDFSNAGADAAFYRSGNEAPVPDQASGTPSTPLTLKISDWEGFLATSKMKPRQIKQYRADVEEFAADLGATFEVTRPRLQRYYESRMNSLSPSTVYRKFTALRNYWAYLESHEVVSRTLKPFDGLKLPRKKSQTIKEEWTPRQVCDLWEAAQARGDHPLAQAIQIAAFTGSRIEAICSLKVDDIVADGSGLAFRFDDKTEAGRRDVPAHPSIDELVRRLIREAPKRDGFLLDATVSNQYAERSTGVGKRFGRLKTKLGYGRSHSFHSLRRTVVGLLAAANCPEAVAADIVGHEKPTMTYGLYRKASSLSEKRKWLEASLHYPNPAFMSGSMPQAKASQPIRRETRIKRTGI